MFATDADLFALDPLPFTELAHLGRHVVRATVSIEGTLATFAQPDIPLAAVATTIGDIVLVAGTPIELTTPIASGQAGVSAPRARGEPAVVPLQLESQIGVLVSFASQRTLTARRMLAHAGLDPDDADQVTRITNAAALADVHACATLALLYRTAGVLLAEDAPINIRARELQRQYELLRDRTPIRLDACARARATPSQPVRA